MYSSLLAYTSPLVGTHLRLTLLLWYTNIKALEVNSFLQISIVEISGLEPELREPKSLVLPLHHISISSRSGRIRTLGGIYLGGFGDRCLKPLGHRPIFIISILKTWYRWLDLNQWPTGYESVALPLSYNGIWSGVRESNPHYFSLEGRCHTIRRTPHCVGREGLEPPYCKANTTICVQTGFTVQRRYLPSDFCSISWNRTKFLWIALQRVLCLRRPSF